MGAERQPDRPVEAMARVARILDVAEEFVDGDVGADLVERDPVDGIGHWLREPDRPAREVPKTIAWAFDPTCQQHAELRANDDLHGEPGDSSEDRLIFDLR